MSDPFLAEIKMFGGNFAPRGYAFCNGQILSISQNTALFSLLGTTYGGNGQTTFGLPDLQGRAPMHPGQGPGLSQRVLGEESGVENVTLLQTEMAAHNHLPQATAATGTQPSPGNTTIWASSAGTRTPPPLYSTTSNTTMDPLILSTVGGNLPHNNLQPYLAISFIIAQQGIFPSRS